MAEFSEKRNNTARLTRNVSKLAFRGKEKMLRSLGVGEETKDEIIDNYVHLVTKQQVQFHKFQRDMKVYLQSITAMQHAANTFYSSLEEVFEDSWMGKDMLSSLSKTTNLLYTDLHARLNTEVITALQDHLTKCNEMKVKVQKRGRKLVDFDAARRNLHTFQNAKKPEESKLMKAREQVQLAHETYETMNGQLHQELPDLHDSRVTLCTDTITSIASAEHAFFIELAEIRTKLLHVLSSLRDAYDGGEYRIQRLHAVKSDGTHQSTLPADDAVGSRSSRDLGAASYQSIDKHDHSENNHDVAEELPVEPRRKRSPNAKSPSKTNDYVNIEIRNAPQPEISDAARLNGHSDTTEEENIYTDVERNESQEDEEIQSTDAAASAPQSAAVASRPVPRRRTHAQASEESLDKSGKAEMTSELSAPLPLQRTVMAAELHRDAYGVEDSPPSENELDRKRETSVKSDQEISEFENKRVSWGRSGSIGKWVSTFSRTSKANQEKDEQVPKKQKGGLFKITKKKKKAKDKSESDVSTTTLPSSPVELPQTHPSTEIHFETMDSVPQRAAPKPDASVEEKNGARSEESNPESIRHVSAAEERLYENVVLQKAAAFSDVSVHHEVSKASNNSDVEINVANEANLAQDNTHSIGKDSSQDHEVPPDAVHAAQLENCTPALTSNDLHREVYDTEAEFYANGEGSADLHQKPPVARVVDQSNHLNDRGFEHSAERPVDDENPLSAATNKADAAACNDVSMSAGHQFATRDTDLHSCGSNESSGDENHSAQAVKQPISGRVDISSSERNNLPEEMEDFDDENREEVYDFATDKVADSTSAIDESRHNVDLSSSATSLSTEQTDDTLGIEPVQEADFKSAELATPSDRDQDFEQHNEIDGPAGNKITDSLTQDKEDEETAPKETSSNSTLKPLAVSSHEQKSIENEISEDLADEQEEYETMMFNETTPSSMPELATSASAVEKKLENPTDGDNFYAAMSAITPAVVPQDSASISDDNGDGIYDTIDVENVHHDEQPLYEEPPYSDGPAVPPREANDTEKSFSNSNKLSPGNEQKEILPPRFLYKAIALFPYKGSDEDELSFVKDDVIYVVEFPDPDEQDEGWQMGILRSSWEDTGSTSGMAVFPENFTKKM